MTFKEAIKQLKTLAGNKYRAIYYEATFGADDTLLDVQCAVYVDSSHRTSGHTWEEALTNMKYELGLKKRNLSEAPLSDKQRK